MPTAKIKHFEIPYEEYGKGSRGPSAGRGSAVLLSSR